MDGHNRLPPRSVSMPSCVTSRAGKQAAPILVVSKSRNSDVHGLRRISESRSYQPQYRKSSYSQFVGGLSALSLQSNEASAQPANVESKPTMVVVDQSQAPARRSGAHRALSCPEILIMIFEQLEALNTVPHETAQRRRKPCSLRHAQMIYADPQRAAEEWQRAQQEQQPETRGVIRAKNSANISADGSAALETLSQAAGLFACLLVNSDWHEAAKFVLSRNIYFSSESRWIDYVRSSRQSPALRKPKLLVLHKLTSARQLEVETIAPLLGGQLEWLEFYSCRDICPSIDLLGGGRLKKIVLPGCARADDRLLQSIAEKCPLLEHLDLRACEAVSDRGLKIIAKHCPLLTLINVGRINNGDLVTYKGIKHLARQTQLNTLGAAGCSIDDRAIWEIALNRGESMQRLSLNNCRLLSDASLPRVLGYMPNLTVLEMRGCLMVTQLRPFVLFKQWKETRGNAPLIEGCEVLEQRMQLAAQQLNRELSQQILDDLQAWLYEETV